MTEAADLKVLAEFAAILEGLGIVYAIGGSIASSVYGQIRFTQDADVTVEPFDDKVEKFYEEVKSNFYIGEAAMYEAIKQRRSFNIIHVASAFKIDVFIREDTEFNKQVLDRRRLLKLDDSIERSFSVVSPEDIVLLKLKWYREGGCSSEKQWQDILGVLRIQKDELDAEYLKKWAEKLGVDDLLDKVQSEIGSR
jgi:hypothetical protein